MFLYLFDDDKIAFTQKLFIIKINSIYIFLKYNFIVNIYVRVTLIARIIYIIFIYRLCVCVYVFAFTYLRFRFRFRFRCFYILY